MCLRSYSDSPVRRFPYSLTYMHDYADLTDSIFHSYYRHPASDGVQSIWACITISAGPVTESLFMETTSPVVLPVSAVWRPAASATSCQWQLNDLPIGHTIYGDMYDIDLFDNDAATVANLHAEGRTVICYVNAGGWETWRPDADEVPETIIRANLDDWEGERWLDIRSLGILALIMGARMDQCKLKGFDGIEPDNVDGFLNDTGFSLTYDDQLRYNIWLAESAHERGLSIGLKNDMDQISDLLPYFDWALNEECFEFNECETPPLH